MSITAIRITTTVRIDRIETYSKNAAVLPNSAFHRKPRSGIACKLLAHNPPRTSHTTNTITAMVPRTP